MPIEHIELVDEILACHAAALGADLEPYRNHVYRVTNFCLALAQGQPVAIDKLAVAAAFHDLGIWTHRTFDYIQPSMDLAHDHLAQHGRTEWSAEVEAMIRYHHALRSQASRDGQLVELFRRADWVDVSLGLRSFGLPRSLMQELFACFPDRGFHKRLAQLALHRAVRHPLSPLPMLRF